MPRKLGKGTRVIIQGKFQGKIERGAGGGDYVVRMDDGARWVKNVKDIVECDPPSAKVVSKKLIVVKGTIADMKAMAAEHDIDLGNAKKKADIEAIIRKSLAD